MYRKQSQPLSKAHSTHAHSRRKAISVGNGGGGAKSVVLKKNLRISEKRRMDKNIVFSAYAVEILHSK